MEFTKKEQELMDVLWKAGRPLSSKEIVENSIDKTWKDSSIHILLNSLLDKGAIKEAGYVRTGKGYGRTFEPLNQQNRVKNIMLSFWQPLRKEQLLNYLCQLCLIVRN